MKGAAAGSCVGCQALVALRADGSCPGCGLVDALRPLPRMLTANRPNLKRSAAFTATRVATFFVAPVVGVVLALEAWGARESVPSLLFPLVLLASLILGLALGPALGALVAYLPWLTVQGVNRAVIGPYHRLRWRRRVGPTFQDAFAKLASRRAELSDQSSQMERTLAKVREALQSRGADAAQSRQRLSGAEQALSSGIQARGEALESVDAVWYEVELQQLECEIAALRLLPCATAETAKTRLSYLQQLESWLGTRSASANALRDAGRRARALRAWQSATECLRSARDHFHAIEDGSLLARAARLLQDVQPTQENHHASPAVASFGTFDQGATLLRVSSAVAECVEQRLRVEAELEAVAEVDAICEVEPAGPSARPALHGRR